MKIFGKGINYRCFQSGVKLAGTEREVGNGSNCRNNDWSTLYKEPGSESHCLLGELKRILEISDSDIGREIRRTYKWRRFLRRCGCGDISKRQKEGYFVRKKDAKLSQGSYLKWRTVEARNIYDEISC